MEKWEAYLLPNLPLFLPIEEEDSHAGMWGWRWQVAATLKKNCGKSPSKFWKNWQSLCVQLWWLNQMMSMDWRAFVPRAWIKKITLPLISCTTSSYMVWWSLDGSCSNCGDKQTWLPRFCEMAETGGTHFHEESFKCREHPVFLFPTRWFSGRAGKFNG